MKIAGFKAALILTSSFASIVAQPAFAQEASDEESEATGRKPGEIVVTAQRREQLLTDVPLSVTAIGAEAIEQEYPRNLTDFSRISPNFTIEPVGAVSRSSAVIFTRGVGYSGVDSVEPPIAVSIDGIFYAVNVGSLLNTYDLSQIEILKGPQGTLFGRNTTGGVVQIRTKDPTQDFEVSGLLRTGSFGRFDTNLALNVPISDTLSARIAAQTLHSEGAYRNTFVDPNTGIGPDGARTGGDESQSIRGKLLWEPNPGVSVKLTSWLTRQDQDAAVGTNASGPGERLFDRGRPGIGQPGGPTDPYVITRDTNGRDKITQYAVVLDAVIDTGLGFDITSISVYMKTKSRQLTDFDASDLNFFTSNGFSSRFQLSQEIRLQSNDAASRLQWQAGVFYFKTNWETRQVNIIGPSFFANTTASSPVLKQFLGSDTYAESIAGFGQAEFQVLDDFYLTVGGRYTYEKKSIDRYPVLVDFDSPLPTPLFAEASWKDFTYHLSARYNLTPDAMVYASYSTGMKAGGFSSQAATLGQLQPFDPEEAKSWELGLKANVLDDMLRLNLTAFSVKYDDLQVTAFRPANTTSGQESFVANAAFERARGVEFEATLFPVAGLRLSSAIGYLDAKYTSFVAALSYSYPGAVCNGVDVNGDPIQQDHSDPNDPCFLVPQRTPEWTVRLDGSYDIDLGNGHQLTPHVSYSFEDAHFTNSTNAPQGFQDGFSQVNADLTYRDPDDRFRVSLFVKNLTDTVRLLNANPIAGLFTVNYYAEPRTWGAEVGFKF